MRMKLLLIKSLFCPNMIYLQQNFETLLKLDTYFTIVNQYETDLLILGWTNTFSTEIEIRLGSNKFLHFNKIIKDYWSTNFGKYHLFNVVQDFLAENEYDYIIYVDHDIYFEMNASDSLSKMLSLLGTNVVDIPEAKEIGLIIPNQKEDCRHQNDIYENRYQVNEINICWSDAPESMACGCFITTSQIFASLDKFDVVSVYGFDDMHLIRQIQRKKMMAVITENIFVVHPISTNKKYDEWKFNMVVDLINGNNRDYYSMLTESVQLWMNI